MRRLAAILTLCLLGGLAEGQQAQFGSLPDITGTGATVQLTASSITVRWVQLVTPTGNAAVVRWGDSNVSVSRGAIIAPGGGQFVPPIPPNQNAPSQNTVNLSTLYLYIASGDKVSVTYIQ